MVGKQRLSRIFRGFGGGSHWGVLKGTNLIAEGCVAHVKEDAFVGYEAHQESQAFVGRRGEVSKRGWGFGAFETN